MTARLSLRRLLAPAAVLAVAVLFAAGCGGGGGSLGSGVVASVGGQEITQGQLDEVIAQASDRLESQGQKVPAAGSEEYKALQQSALQYLVQRAEQAQQADKLGVTVTDKQVQERLDRVIKQYFGGSKKKYEASLVKQGVTDEQVQDELRATLISEGIFNKVGESAVVTPEEIVAYYKSNPALYTKQPSREVRHILVKTKSEADDIYAQLKAGADFAVLAKKYSTDPGSKDVGGKLIEVKGQFVPEFEKVAWKLEVNELAKPVKSQFGWHVIQALGPISKLKTTPLDDETKQTIRETLLGQKKTDTVTKWLEEQKLEYASKIHYAAGFAPPATETTPTATS